MKNSLCVNLKSLNFSDAKFFWYFVIQQFAFSYFDVFFIINLSQPMTTMSRSLLPANARSEAFRKIFWRIVGANASPRCQIHSHDIRYECLKLRNKPSICIFNAFYFVIVLRLPSIIFLIKQILHYLCIRSPCWYWR